MKTEDMIMVSIDPGTESLGFAIFTNGKLTDFSNLKTKKNDENKIQTMAELLLTALEQAHPSQIVMEDIYQGKSITTMKGNAILQGVVLSYCLRNDTLLWLFKTSEWRNKLGIKNEKRDKAKQNDIQYVLEHTNIRKEELNDDVADAICIGLAYCKLFQ